MLPDEPRDEDEQPLEEPLLDGADEVAPLEGWTVPLLPADPPLDEGGGTAPEEPAPEVPPDDPDEAGAPDPLVVEPDEVLGLPLPEGADEPGGALAAEDDGALPEEPLLPEEPEEPEVPDDDEPGGALAAEDDGALPEDPLLPDEPEVPDDDEPAEDDPLPEPLLERPDEETDPLLPDEDGGTSEPEGDWLPDEVPEDPEVPDDPEPLTAEEDGALDAPLLEGPDELGSELLPEEEETPDELGGRDELLAPLEDEPDEPDDPDEDDSQHPRPNTKTSHRQLSA